MFTIINQIDSPKWKTKIPLLQVEGEKLLNYLAIQNNLPWEEVNLSFVDEGEMIRLHEQYFNDPRPTDVLTFDDNTETTVNGDIAIYLKQVWQNANSYKLPRSYLFYETMLHGFLHLYGLKHDYEENTLKEIYQEQKKILNLVRPDESIISDLL